VIRTNADARNFRLVEVPEDRVADRTAWRDLIPASPDVLVEDFALARKFVAARVRTGGLRKVEVVPAHGAAFFVDASEPTYMMFVDDLPDPDTAVVRYNYISQVTPRTTFELDVATRARTKIQIQPVPGYDPANYTAEYLHARASDGTQIPISVVYRKDTRRAGAPARRCWSMATDRTATRPSRSSTPAARRCSTAAGCSPSRTSAAARSSAGPGTRTAS